MIDLEEYSIRSINIMADDVEKMGDFTYIGSSFGLSGKSEFSEDSIVKRIALDEF